MIPRRQAYAALFALTAINLLNYLDRYVSAGFLPLLKAEFQRSDAELGSLSFYFLVVYSIAGPIVGILSNKMPRRFFVGGGVLIWSLATLWSGSARTFEELTLARMLIGIGEAGYATIAPSFIADLFDPDKRGRMISYFSAAMPVGIAIGYAVGGSIGERYGWRQAFYFAGAPGLLLGIGAFFMKEPPRAQIDPELAKQQMRLPTILRELWARRSFRVNCLGTAAFTFAMGGLAQWMPTYLNRERGISLERAGFLFGLCLLVAGLLGALVGGSLGDRIQRKNPNGYYLVTGFGLVLGVPCALGAVLAPQPLLFWGCTLLALFFLLSNIGPVNAALLNTFPSHLRPTSNAVYVLVMHFLGDAISPWLIGKVSDTAGLKIAVASNAAVIALAAVIFLVGAKTLSRDLATYGDSP